MAQQTINRPDSEEEQGNEVYDPQVTPAGDPSDPRGDLPRDTRMGGVGDPSSRVYDDSGTRYDGEEEKSGLGGKLRKGLGAARGLSSGRGVSRANNVRKRLKNAEDSPGHNDEETGRGPASPSDLDDAEDEEGRYNPDGDEAADDSLYNENDKEPYRKRAGRFIGRHKKAMTIGGGIGLGVIGGGVGLFLLLLPLKIENIVDNLQSDFFSTSQQAMSTEMRNMLKNYLITRVLPGYKSCGSTIKAGCSARKFGSNPVASMFNTWSDNKLEQKLADKKIVLEYKSYSNKWYIEAPSINGATDIGTDGDGLGRVIDNHVELRSSLDKLLTDETKWYQVYTRYKWGRYFERNLGLPRCVIVCHIVGKDRYDTFKTTVANKKIAAYTYLTAWAITPHTDTLGIALECLLQDCVADNNQPSGTDGINGTPEDADVDTKMREALTAYAGDRLAGASIDDLVETYKKLEDQGLQKYLVTEGLQKIGFSEGAAGAAGDAIPIAGWVNLAAQMVTTGNDASGNLKKLRFAVNARTDAAIFGMWLVYADEIHTGSVDSTELGSFTSSLGPGTQGDPNGTPVGGTASAEQTKLYQNLIGGSGSSGSADAATAFTDNPLVGQAYADSPSSTAGNQDGETCGNGGSVPAGQLICPEDFLGGGVSIANTIHSFLNLPGNNVLVAISKGWMDTFGLVFKYGGDLLSSVFTVPMDGINATCDLPGPAGLGVFAAYCAARDEAKKVIPVIANGVTSALIPDPFGTPMGGGRQFVSGAGGADYLGNDSCTRLLGCQAITTNQKSQIVAAQEKEDKQQFSQESFFARMFSTSSQYSLVSKLSMDVPFGGAKVIGQDTVASMLNPFGALTHGFSSIFSGQANADPAPQDDAHGVQQTGYPPGTIPDDASAYWDAHCSDNEANAYQQDNSWNESASGPDNADPNTGEPLFKKTNPCLLIKAATGSGGGLWDTGNLTKDDLADLNGSSGSAPTTGTAGYQNPFRDVKGLVTTRVDEGVDYYGTGPVYAIGNGVVSAVSNDDGSSLWWGSYGGYSVVYKLTDGPAAGKYVYVAEHCPVRSNIHAGASPTEVTSSTVLCDMQPASIETGWALGNGTDEPSAGSIYTESSATAYGQNFEELMESLGVSKACYDHPGAPLQGSIPTDWPAWTTSPATKAGPNICS